MEESYVLGCFYVVDEFVSLLVGTIYPTALYLALRFSFIFLFGGDWHQLFMPTAPGQVRRLSGI